jgi:hypothetical protein
LDPLIKSQLLYQLSYAPATPRKGLWPSQRGCRAYSNRHRPSPAEAERSPQAADASEQSAVVWRGIQPCQMAVLPGRRTGVFSRKLKIGCNQAGLAELKQPKVHRGRVHQETEQ